MLKCQTFNSVCIFWEELTSFTSRVGYGIPKKFLLKLRDGGRTQDLKKIQFAYINTCWPRFGPLGRNRSHQWGFGCQDRSSCCLQIFGFQYRNNYYLGQFDLQGKCTHYLPVSDFQDKHIFLGPKFDCWGRHKYCQSIFDHQDSLQDAKLRMIKLGKKLKWK